MANDGQQNASKRKVSSEWKVGPPKKNVGRSNSFSQAPNTSGASRKSDTSRQLSSLVATPQKRQASSEWKEGPPKKHVGRSNSFSQASTSIGSPRKTVLERTEPTPPRPPTAKEVLQRGYPQGFLGVKDFRNRTQGIAKLARDGEVFVSGSSITGFSFKGKDEFGRPAKFRPSSDIDVGVASRRLREDKKQVQQAGRGRAFPVRGSDLDKAARGRTRGGHPIGVKVFYGIPSERVVLKRPHTPEWERTDD